MLKTLRWKRGLGAAAWLRCRAGILLPAGAVALAGVLTSSAAVAQGAGVLTGTVRDASTKTALADVVVTATSPALQGEQTVVTDASGQYRIPNLPPGEYSLRFDRDSYRPGSRGGISMRASSTIRVGYELLPEQVTLKAEEVVVVSKAPTVDVGSSSTGVSLNQDFTNRLPLSSGNASRSFESLATVAPGAQADRFGVSISGTTSPENAFVIDGVGVNSPAYGTLATPLSVEFVKEVNVVSGGYMPEYGRAMGGIFDVTTQSGSNEFHGSVFFNITPGALEGPRREVKRDGTTISTNPGLGSLRDFGATLGGPILKDRLWFFGGLQAAFTRNTLERTLNEIQLDPMTGTPKVDPSNGLVLTKPIPGTTKHYYADDQTIQYIGKLTFLFNQDHNISLSVYGTPTTSGGNGTFMNPVPPNIIGPYSAYAAHQVANSNDLSLKYSGAFNNKHQLIDVTLGWHHQRAATLPNDGSEIGTTEGMAGVPQVSYRRSIPDTHRLTDFERVPAGYCKDIVVPDTGAVVNPCPVTDYTLGGFGQFNESAIDSYQARIVGTGLFSAAGHHVAKAGFEMQYATYKNTRAWSGLNYFRESDAGDVFDAYHYYGFLTDPDVPFVQNKTIATTSTVIVGGFLQDSWQIMDKVTLNAGLRYDTQVIYAADGTVALMMPNQWSPRVGVIYDFTQQGRSKLFANFARYYEGVPLDIADRSFPGEFVYASTHPAARPGQMGCNPASNDASSGYRSPACIGKGTALPPDSPAVPDRAYYRIGGDSVPVDPTTGAQSSDEIVVGGEYEIFPDGRVGVSYTHRYLNKVVEDMSNDEANTYFIGNPGYGIGSTFPKAVRTYDAVTFYFQKAFSHTWLAQASYTISSLRGNYSGLFRPETGQLDPNITNDFDIRSILGNRTGPLPFDQTHQIKVYGAKDFQLPANMDILLGLTFRTESGTPQNYFGSNSLYGLDEVFILPRGAAGRGDWIFHFDARVGYSVQLGKQRQIGVTLDVFNLFNFQGVTQRDNRFTSADVLPIIGGTTKDLPTAKSSGKLRHEDGTPFDPAQINPNFGNPTQYQDPRQFRFGAKVTF